MHEASWTVKHTSARPKPRVSRFTSSPEGYPRETPWTGEEAAALWRQPEPHTRRQLNWACVVMVGFISKLRVADDSLIYSCALGCYMYLD